MLFYFEIYFLHGSNDQVDLFKMSICALVTTGPSLHIKTCRFTFFVINDEGKYHDSTLHELALLIKIWKKYCLVSGNALTLVIRNKLFFLPENITHVYVISFMVINSVLTKHYFGRSSEYDWEGQEK